MEGRKDRFIAILAIGEVHRKLFEINKESWKRYAAKCDADLILLDKTEGELFYSPAWAKLYGLHSLLGIYKRGMYVDSDAMIDDENAPNIFNVVAEDEFGAFFEGYVADRRHSMLYALDMYKIKTDRIYDNEYFNSGVMVMSAMHRDLFMMPDITTDNFYEQGCLNARVFGYGVKVKQLSHLWNRMGLVDHMCGQELHAAYIVHWAGNNDYELIGKQMVEIREKFKDKANAKTRFYVCVGGGLGDAATCEPIFRYAIEDVYQNDPNVEWHIFTYPDYECVLRELKKYKNVFFYKREEDMPQELVFKDLKMPMPHREAYTHPHGSHVVRMFFPYADVHNQDYGSLCLLMQTIHPRWAKQPRIPVYEEDRKELFDIIGKQEGINGKDLFYHSADRWPPETHANINIHPGHPTIVIHPGTGWPSKTFPIPYWQEIIERCSKLGVVILMGKNKFLDVKLPANGNGIDLRNKIETRHVLALLEQSTMVISNDSSPIHMAAAYNNYIVMIASCKRPELVMPYRNGRQDYKALAIWHKLTCEALDKRPTDMITPSLADISRGSIEDYLPSVDFVMGHVGNILKDRPVYIPDISGWEQRRE